MARKPKAKAPRPSTKQGPGGKFTTGHKGPGRPKGSKHRLQESFLSALVADFEKNRAGAAAIVRARRKDPVAYLRMVASLMPKEIKAEVTKRELVHYSDEELLELAAEALRRDPGSEDEAEGPGLSDSVH